MKTYRVEFVGGPMDGLVNRFCKADMVSHISFVSDREYLYRFAFRHGTEGSAPLRIKRRYVFQGHKAEMPEGIDHAD